MDKEQLDFTEDEKKEITKLFGEYYDALDEDSLYSYITYDAPINESSTVHHALVKWSIGYWHHPASYVGGSVCAGCCGRCRGYWSCGFHRNYYPHKKHLEKDCPITSDLCQILLADQRHLGASTDSMHLFIKKLLILHGKNTKNNLDFLMESAEEVAAMLEEVE